MLQDLTISDDPSRVQDWEIGPIVKPTMLLAPVGVEVQLGIIRIRALGHNPPAIFTFVSNNMVLLQFATQESFDYDVSAMNWRTATIEQPLFYKVLVGRDLLCSVQFPGIKIGERAVIRGFAFSMNSFPDLALIRGYHGARS
jgi:hypothetical protein